MLQLDRGIEMVSNHGQTANPKNQTLWLIWAKKKKKPTLTKSHQLWSGLIEVQTHPFLDEALKCQILSIDMTKFVLNLFGLWLEIVLFD